MNESEVPEPEVSLPVAVGGRSPKRCMVTLPQTDLILCVDLAQQIADAIVPGQIEGRSGYPTSRRATWSEAITGGSPYPPSVTDSLRPGSQPTTTGNPEGNSPHQDRWLKELERRWRDLQEWVDRGDISIFGSDWIKYRHVSYDTYLRRQDAVRYCQESGFEVAVDQETANGLAAELEQEIATTIASAAPQEMTPSSKQVSSAPSKSETPRQLSLVSAPAGAMLRPKVAMARTGLPRSTFYERQNPKSRYFDPTFPQARSLGEGSVGYLEAEVEQWIAARPAARRPA